jgi:hypothetical protein
VAAAKAALLVDEVLDPAQYLWVSAGHCDKGP